MLFGSTSDEKSSEGRLPSYIADLPGQKGAKFLCAYARVPSSERDRPIAAPAAGLTSSKKEARPEEANEIEGDRNRALGT